MASEQWITTTQKAHVGETIRAGQFSIYVVEIEIYGRVAIWVTDSKGQNIFGKSKTDGQWTNPGNTMVFPSPKNPYFIISCLDLYIDDSGNANNYFATFKIDYDAIYAAPPTPTPIPEPAPGPQINVCEFPALSLNFIAVMSGLASWLGCMVRNIILLIQWIVDWILHYPDHLDAWISRLFGVDPSLPFFDEVLKKIDIWISGKFGVDPALPFWEELVKKALTWIAEVINTSAQNRIQERKW